MPEPTAALHAVRASTADLLLGVENEGWDDADVRVASLCPGWTRGHVLTHVARNADGLSATLAGALRGEIVPRYADGARDADIEAGSSRPLSELVADLRTSAERLDRVFGAVAEADAWGRPAADGRTAAEWMLRRLVEVELHRVDLGGGYSPDRWPPLLVAELLPLLVGTLEERASCTLQVTVAATGSVVPELAGRSWTVGAGPATTVEGPDWALVAWLAGRPGPVQDVLGATPGLAPWR